jgi:hypothetical protein
MCLHFQVKKRLGIEPPPKRLVEQYLTEIAKNYNIAYCPDPGVMSVRNISLCCTNNLFLDVDIIIAFVSRHRLK